MDLDRTTWGESLELRPRLIEAVKSAAAAGITPIVATGRMLRSSRPYALQLGVTAPLICYQGRSSPTPYRASGCATSRCRCPWHAR